jgi:hypothetical protein
VRGLPQRGSVSAAGARQAELGDSALAAAADQQPEVAVCGGPRSCPRAGRRPDRDAGARPHAARADRLADRGPADQVHPGGRRAGLLDVCEVGRGGAVGGQSHRRGVRRPRQRHSAVALDDEPGRIDHVEFAIRPVQEQGAAAGRERNDRKVGGVLGTGADLRRCVDESDRRATGRQVDGDRRHRVVEEQRPAEQIEGSGVLGPDQVRERRHETGNQAKDNDQRYGLPTRRARGRCGSRVDPKGVRAHGQFCRLGHRGLPLSAFSAFLGAFELVVADSDRLGGSGVRPGYTSERGLLTPFLHADLSRDFRSTVRQR